MPRTVERIPLVKPGLASCLACHRANLRGGVNDCPIKTLRDHEGADGRMRRSLAGDQFECGSFKPLNSTQHQHRLGLHVGKTKADNQDARGQESLF